MKNTIIFLGILISAVLTWFGYALFASLITDVSLNRCLSDNTVLGFLFSTGWILPSLVGFDLYRHLNRHRARREKRIANEIREISENTFGSRRKNIHNSLFREHYLN